MAHSADIELTLEAGMIVLRVIDPLTDRGFTFSMRPANAADLAAALLELGNEQSPAMRAMLN